MVIIILFLGKKVKLKKEDFEVTLNEFRIFH